MSAIQKTVKKRTKRDRAGTVTGHVWRARYVHPATGKEHTAHRGTKAEALAWLDAETAALVTGTWISRAAGSVTLRDFYSGYADLQVWKPGTRRAMDLAVLSAPFADEPLQAITAVHVQAWVKDMSSRLAPGTVKTRFTNVRTVLRAAVQAKQLREDPTEGVKLPARRKRAAAMRIPEPEQVAAMLDAAEDRWRALFAVCAFAGLRLGEAAALQVEDIDFLGRTIHVRRQVQRETGGRVEISLPKYGSERDVELPDALAEVLARHVEEHVHATSDGTRWLFGFDAPPSQNTVGYQWRKARVDGFRLHDLRHFYASGLIRAGLDVVTVQRALGHSSPTVTLSTYSHLWPDASERTRKAADGLVAQVLDYGWTTGPDSGAPERETA